MAYWDGDKWAAETSPDPVSRGRKPTPRALGGIVVAAIVAGLILVPHVPTSLGTDLTNRILRATGVPGATKPGGPGTAAGSGGGTTIGTPGPDTAAGGGGSISSNGKAPAPATNSTTNPTQNPLPTKPPAPLPTNHQGPTTPLPPPLPSAGGTTVYLHYYLWWTKRHWQDKLGTAYPYTASPLPLPGLTDASGCNPVVSYPGSTIVDIPSVGLADQALAATFDSNIKTAVAYGITGFVADWAGVGTTSQGPTSSGYNARLDLLVKRVDAWNATHAQKFRLALDFAAFGNYGRSATAIINDLAYFIARYGTDGAFANSFSGRPLVMFIGSRKYAAATVAAVSAATRGSLFLLGDETSTSLARDAAYLDGSSYYWSSESPMNSGAKSQIASLGSQLHGAGKPWFAPFTAGYDSVLIGGHCVPRNGVKTLDTIWSWNSASKPDAWFGISWNEYVENTYLEPSMKYGAAYLAEVKRLAGL